MLFEPFSPWRFGFGFPFVGLDADSALASGEALSIVCALGGCFCLLAAEFLEAFFAPFAPFAPLALLVPLLFFSSFARALSVLKHSPVGQKEWDTRRTRPAKARTRGGYLRAT